MFLLIGKNGILLNKINIFINIVKLLEYNCIVFGVLVDKEFKKVDCMCFVSVMWIGNIYLRESIVWLWLNLM